MKFDVDRYAKRVMGDPDHPCSDDGLEPVPTPPFWERRSKGSRCRENVEDIPGISCPDIKDRDEVLNVVPPDVGLVDVRPNVRRAGKDEGCRTIFLAWSIYSHLDRCVVARSQDIWLLGARLHVDETEANRARAGKTSKSGAKTRNKNVNAWFSGLYAPPGSIEPDPSSAMDIRYDPWSVVHPGFYETDPSDRGNPRLGRPVRDDRFSDAIQFAAAHIWIDRATCSPRTVSYRALRKVDLRTMPSGSLSRASIAAPLAIGALLGAGVMHWSKKR